MEKGLFHIRFRKFGIIIENEETVLPNSFSVGHRAKLCGGNDLRAQGSCSARK